jgi:hypothetical protein
MNRQSNLSNAGHNDALNVMLISWSFEINADFLKMPLVNYGYPV